MIDAVIFDMDGVIIDSEPIWADAQKEIFTSLGLIYKEEIARQTIGTGTIDTVSLWYHHQPWEGVTFDEVKERIHTRMLSLIREKGKMMDGLTDILDYFRNKGTRLALASGSPYILINQVTEQLGIKKYFEVIHSAEHEEYGKPHPAVFLSVAKKLGLSPLNCAVVEDSFNGLIAAKAARMKAIAYLPNEEYNKSKYDFADLKLSSHGQFNDTNFNYLQNLI